MGNKTKQISAFFIIISSFLIVYPIKTSKPESQLKIILKTVGQEAKKILVSSAQYRPDILFICGIILAAGGSCFLLRTIITDIPKILGSTTLIGTGAALIFFANKNNQSNSSP